jgi:hypothetical protein
VEIILDDSCTLEERFEKIYSRLVVEKLKDEQKDMKGSIRELKKIIQKPDLPEQLTMLFAGRQN